MNEKLKAKLEELKAAAKRNAPTIITGATAVMGTVGWIVAGIYAQKVKELGEKENFGLYGKEHEDEWPCIQISPNAFKDVLNGSTLLLRQFDTDDDRTVVQFTTRADGFPPEADETFNKYNKTAGTTTLSEN